MTHDERRLQLAHLALSSTTATIGLTLALTAGLHRDWVPVGLGLAIAWFAGRHARSVYVRLRDAE